MPEFVRYLVRVETKVVVYALPITGGEQPVGEYVVRSEARAATDTSSAIPSAVETAMAKATKSARTMAAAVDNTERNRLK